MKRRTCLDTKFLFNAKFFLKVRVGKLRKMTGFWKGLFFMGNQCKMRKALMKYLHEEGLKCKLEDGIVIFEFNECNFIAEFNIHEGYAECEISYCCGDNDYEALDIQDKTFTADKVNTDKENHCIVLAFNDNLKLRTSFYFTNKRMMLDLFSQHFEELTDSLETALDIVCEKIERQKAYKNRRIGFNANSSNPPSNDTENMQALRK